MSELTAALPTKYGPLSEKLVRRSLSERLPLVGGIELTHRCNLACVHCYVNLAPNDREAQRREMTTEEIYGVLDQLVAAGTLWLTFTGGEPLLRPDFADIYRYAHRLGFLITVYTNATLITERIVELWLEHPPRLLEITQYGFTPETYDRVTDAGAQYDRFRRGLDRVRAAGIAVTLKTMAMRDNAHEVGDIRRYARAEGLRFRFDAVISPRIDGGRGPLRQRLSPAEVAAIEADDQERQDSFAEYCQRDSEHVDDGRRYQCGAGVSTFLIDPYGKMHVCELSRRPGWDVLRDGFAEGFFRAFVEVRQEKRAHADGCGTCAATSMCSNCTGMAELERLSPDDGNPYFCQVTDARGERMFGATRPTPNGIVKLRRGRDGAAIET